MTRLLTAIGAGGASFFILGVLIYGVVLRDFYAGNLGSAIGVVREQPVWWALLLSQLGYAAMLTFVLTRAGVAGAVPGLKTGLVFGLVLGFAIAFDLYAVTNWSNVRVALVEPIVTAGRMATAGLVVGWALRG